MAVAFFIVIDGCGLTGHRVLVLDEADDVLRDKEEKKPLNKAMPTRKAVISRVGCSARLFFFFPELLEINRPMIGGFSYVHAHTRRRGEKKHACLLLFDFSFPTHSLLFHSFAFFTRESKDDNLRTIIKKRARRLSTAQNR